MLYQLYNDDMLLAVELALLALGEDTISLEAHPFEYFRRHDYTTRRSTEKNSWCARKSYDGTLPDSTNELGYKFVEFTVTFYWYHFQPDAEEDGEWTLVVDLSMPDMITEARLEGVGFTRMEKPDGYISEFNTLLNL